MAKHRFTVYVNAITPAEIRPPKGSKRTYLFVQNPSAGDIYYEEGTIATSENGNVIGAGQTQELSENLGKAVPDGNVWITGSVAAPATQRVLVTQS